jgi:general secretion pathway protein A
MYLNYWNLKKFPFENVADPSFFYLSQSHEEALSRLLYASRLRKGAAMLTGDIGCGKTLISRVYKNKVKEAGTEIVLLTNPPYKPIEFLQSILYQLGIGDPPDSKARLLQILGRKMVQNLENNKGTIIVIDEAQGMPEETFEEARLLLNFQNSHRFLLTLILIGQPELRAKIKHIKPLDQRIPIRFHIHPFDFMDTIKYIMFREKNAGFEKNIFTKQAMQQIYEYAGGLPRKINSVCDMSLLTAYNKKRRIINPAIIESVTEDLE